MDSETIEYEDRLSAALARIDAHEARERRRREAASDPEALAAIKGALADERAANAGLDARIGALRDRQQAVIAALTAQLAGIHRDIARLTAANADLAAANRALIGKAVLGQDDDPIRDAFAAEIAALHAARVAEIGVMDDILGAFDNLLARAPASVEDGFVKKGDADA